MLFCDVLYNDVFIPCQVVSLAVVPSTWALRCFFSSCLWLVHFIIVGISLRVLCGSFIGSDVMLL